jgi:hypothetical protein
LIVVEGYRDFKAVNLQRYAVLKGEYLVVAEGFVMVVDSPVLRVSGYVRLYGVLRIGNV